MNPVLPHLRHNNTFLRPSQESKDFSLQVNQNSSSYRRVFPHSVAYGPLIPPSSSIARAVMGNSSSNNDTETTTSPRRRSSVEKESNNTQEREPERRRSNLSALMDQQQSYSGDLGLENPKSSRQEAETETHPLPEGIYGEADSASGPPPTNLTSTRSAPSVFIPSRTEFYPKSNSTPPTAIPLTIRPLMMKSNSSNMRSDDSVSSEKVRRCMSSKELGTLAPPSGSPYAFMLQQKERLEYVMAERLKQTREHCLPDQSLSSSPVTLPDDASSISAALRTRMANEARNKRRAEHNQAVADDLCEIVTDMFIAESKLLNPSKYGVDPSVQRDEIFGSVKRFLDSLPTRYALGAETPSEVLLHMRLMAAVRADDSRAVVHIMNLEGDSYRTKSAQGGAQGTSRRLVTIACADVTGLLEFVSKLLATGGSRVLDADVMLSSDNIVLDRFVVEMHGRLRLDKLANYIEDFLKGAKARKGEENVEARAETGSNTSSLSLNSTSKTCPTTGNVYFSAPSNTPDVPTPQDLREEMDAAVPLAEVLASRGSTGKLPSLPSSGGSFNILSRHMSLLPSSIEAPLLPSSLPGRKSRSPGSLPNITLEKRTQPEPEFEATPVRQRRPLVNRQGSADLDMLENESNDEMPFDYVTLDVSGSGVINRLIPLIPFEELMLIETLGMGRVSTIYRAAWQRKSGNHFTAPLGIQMVALKVAMVNPETLDTSHVDEVRREADIAARLQHPNICDLVGVAADSECFCLAYEFCEGGSLLSLLSDTTRYYEYLPIALDIANGMAYLHSRNVIHRDLKPSNILLTRDHRAKIADFGMSVANTGQELTAETGTYRYMAPEVIRHESYSSNADVYSFGLCLWQLITREVPFATMTPIQAAYAVAEGRRPTIPSSTPRRLQEIIEACWDHDSHKRPSFTYVAMALADYVKMAFSPANVGAQTLHIANEMLANVEGNSTVNVDFSTPVSMLSPYSMYPDVDFGSNVGLEI